MGVWSRQSSEGLAGRGGSLETSLAGRTDFFSGICVFMTYQQASPRTAIQEGKGHMQKGKGHKPSVTQSQKSNAVTGAKSVSPGHTPRKEGYAPSLKAGAPESVRSFPQFLSALPDSSPCFPTCSFLLQRCLGSSCTLTSSPS